MMDEARKKRLTHIWLRVLYIGLWSLGVIAALAVSTWLAALWRYAAFAAVGVVLGAYLTGRTDSVVAQIARAAMALVGAVAAVWFALSVAREPTLLAPLGLAGTALVLYGAAVLTSVWFVRAITREPLPAVEASVEVEPTATTSAAEAAAQRTLEVVAETKQAEEETAEAPAAQGE